jgi:hypothetical protein
MQNTEKNFANGFILTRRNGAPEFVIGNVAINVAEFTEWLNTYKNEKGWVNLDLKQAQSGKFYAEQNTWQPSNTETKEPQTLKQEVEADDDDLPF